MKFNSSIAIMYKIRYVHVKLPTSASQVPIVLEASHVSKDRAIRTMRTNVIRVKLVDAPYSRTRPDPQSPCTDRAKNWEFTLVDVIVDTRVEAYMRVDDEGDRGYAIDDGLDDGATE